MLKRSGAHVGSRANSRRAELRGCGMFSVGHRRGGESRERETRTFAAVCLELRYSTVNLGVGDIAHSTLERVSKKCCFLGEYS